MLLPEHVKPFLMHKEPVIRNHAAEYFKESFNKDSDLMSLVLKSCEKYGEEKNQYLLDAASNFTQTEDTLREVIDRHARTDKIELKLRYEKIIASADLELLNELMPEVEGLDSKSNIKQVISQRLQLSTWDTEKLWQELFALSNKNKNKHINGVNYSYGLHIVEALASRKDVPVNEIILCLKDEDKYHSYDELYLTILAGELRLETAVPILLDKLRIDTDLLCECAVNSLVKIGSEDVVRQLWECFLQEDWHFRNFAANIFGDIKLPVCEQALFSLLPREEDISIRTYLADDFCRLFSADAIPLVKEEIDRGYDTLLLDLEESLYVNCRINGVDFPEISPPPQPAVKKRKKIGRNEPCPCGSGKKYKKCCGAPV